MAAQEPHETNPMLGHAAADRGISYPEITEMQARAIIAAPARSLKRT
jgi:pyruvate,orthophosphate dikinase